MPNKKNIKKYSIFSFITVILLSFLFWCWHKKPISTLNFDEYIIPLNITTSFKKINEKEIKNITLKNEILSIYKEKYIEKNEKEQTKESKNYMNNEFKENIIILKTPNYYKDLETFVEDNKKKIKRANFDTDEDTNSEIENCTTEITMSTNKRYLDNNENWNNEYFIQTFFLTKENAYIIAYSTKNKENYLQIYNDFQNISCKKEEKKQYEI